MRFSKMHALGNDFIVTEECEMITKQQVRRLCDRHLGIGADGVLVVYPSEKADFGMKIYNADGSHANMCGNGIRCFAKYVYEKGLTNKKELNIETDAGIKNVILFVQNGKADVVRVNMGMPTYKMTKLDFPVHEVFMGNLHGILYTKNLDLFPLAKIGPYLSVHPYFSDGVNVEAVKIIDSQTIEMRVWERGVGETFACGTGACAAVVASCENGWTTHKVVVKLQKGTLEVEWDRVGNKVYLTGEAVHVFDGEVDV